MSQENENEKMTNPAKAELLESIRTERKALEDLLARLSPADLVAPGAVGVWSVRDALAHISNWERWMLDWIGSLRIGEIPNTPQPWDIDSMNAGAHERLKDMPLDAVQQEFQASYRDSLALVESLGEEQLHRVYVDTWPMGPLWMGVAANMNFHYREHRLDLEKWLAGRAKE